MSSERIEHEDGSVTLRFDPPIVVVIDGRITESSLMKIKSHDICNKFVGYGWDQEEDCRCVLSPGHEDKSACACEHDLEGK